jgi:hypothetical protein
MPRTLALLMVAVSVALPLTAYAQPSDAKYCQTLLAQYDTFVVNAPNPRRSNSAAELAAAKCRAGDPAGIPGLEKALQDAKIDIPRRQGVFP